jgi:hypothetical protein
MMALTVHLLLYPIYQRGQRKTQIPRHTEIVDDLARKICKDLDVPFVR